MQIGERYIGSISGDVSEKFILRCGQKSFGLYSLAIGQEKQIDLILNVEEPSMLAEAIITSSPEQVRKDVEQIFADFAKIYIDFSKNGA